LVAGCAGILILELGHIRLLQGRVQLLVGLVVELAVGLVVELVVGLAVGLAVGLVVGLMDRMS
jgi:hypothetical protein